MKQSFSAIVQKVILTFGVLLLFTGFTLANTDYWSVGDNFLIFKESTDNTDVNVGIGTTDPQAKLDVAGNIASSGKITSASTADNDSATTVTTKDYVDGKISGEIESAGKWSDATGGINYANGNVGIGTSTPAAKLDIAGNSKIRPFKGASHNFDISIVDTTRTTLTDNYGDIVLMPKKNLGIGTTTPKTKLHIETKGTERATMFLGATGTGQASIYLDASDGDFVGSDYVAIVQSDDKNAHIYNNGGDLFLQEHRGNIGIGKNSGLTEKLEVAGKVKATAFLQSSDENLKENISDIPNAEKILDLRGVLFDWKDSGENDLGFIAQEVEKLFPELVVTGKDGFKSVKYGNISAILLEVIKSQNEKLETAEERISILEVQNQKILERLEALEKEE